MNVMQPLLDKIAEGHNVAVCFGGGVDSTAMLIELKNANIRPDIITFADTGGEKPETYDHVRSMDDWLDSVGFPRVTWCKKIPTDRVQYTDLTGNCIENETLPSLAFGMKSCSIKWKQGPQDKVIIGAKSGPNKCDPHPMWIKYQETGRKVIKLIGYDAGKADIRRSKNLKDEDDNFLFMYPLQWLGYERGDCMAAIIKEGLPVPIKSACYFCPASQKWELWWLAGTHPELFEKALEMEVTAMTGHHTRFDEIEMGDGFMELIGSGKRWPSSKTTVGLGRGFAWNHWARMHGVVDNDGKVIATAVHCLDQAEKLQADGGNAVDSRVC